MGKSPKINTGLITLAVGLASWVGCAFAVHAGQNGSAVFYIYRLSELIMLVGIAFLILYLAACARIAAEDPPGASSAQMDAFQQGFGAQLEQTATRLRRLGSAITVGNLVFVFAGMFGLFFAAKDMTQPLSDLAHWSPDTQFLVGIYPSYWVPYLAMVLILGCACFSQLIGELVLLRVARTEPLGFRQARQHEKARGWDHAQLIVYAGMGLLVALLVAGSLVHSYIRVTDKGIVVSAFPGLTEDFHAWNQVTSLSETHRLHLISGRGGSGWVHVHYEEVNFADGTTWRSGYTDDTNLSSSDKSSDTSMRSAMSYIAKRSGHTLLLLDGGRDENWRQ